MRKERGGGESIGGRKMVIQSDTGPLKNTLKSEAITPTHETILPNFEVSLTLVSGIDVIFLQGWNKMRSRMMRTKKEESGKSGRNMMGGKARLRYIYRLFLV